MGSVLYNIIISPIELIVEIIFELMFRLAGQRNSHQGIAIIGVSVVISLLTLPLYARADFVQQKERDTQKKLSRWINHIKKSFTGDERFMMLQAYYRENNYSPIYALKGSVSLLLEIPFFIAAYHFLSHLELLKGASFGFIKDLGEPDSLLHFKNFSVNLLPILMTTINCIASAIYLKGFPLKDKIQTYGLAAVFLVLLYNSPSGLVIYWTCNNIFSLVKNIFYKVKNPKKILVYLCAMLGTLLSLTAVLSGVLNSRKKVLVIFLFQYATLMPIFFYYAKDYTAELKEKITSQKFIPQEDSSAFFWTSGIFLTLFLGILIPSAVISSSPAEFIDTNNYKNPLYFLVNSACYAAGFFLLWSGIIRFMLPKKNRPIFDLIFWTLSGIFIVNYMFFGKNLGVIFPTLVFEKEILFSKTQKLLNLAVILICFFILIFLFRFQKLTAILQIALVLSTGTLCTVNVFRTQKLLKDMSYIKNSKKVSSSEPIFTLSKTGKNVIVFMLDRAISGFVPYLFEEKPVLKEQFAGFTYYPNALSHGFFTNFGTPALFGGYEYTVTEMNNRKDELLVEKQNEALKVLPVLFSRNNFDVTVCDPPYAGYKWIPDLSIFDEYPEIKKYNTSGSVEDKNLKIMMKDNYLDVNKRNFFCYSIFKVLPLVLQRTFYDDGSYFQAKSKSNWIEDNGFTREYSVLTMLPNITGITDEDKNTFLSFTNAATHEAYFQLQLPDYEIKLSVDNSGYKTAADGKIGMDDEQDIIHYHINMASLLAMGKWFDYLRQNDVWDNTRIILVSDHGRGNAQFDYMLMENIGIDVEWCNPLLMVKDFSSNEFSVSQDFMTNADVPTLATEGVIENPINPFTGKEINNDEKFSHPQRVTSSMHWDTTKYNGYTFDTSDGHWFSVHDNIFDESNWKKED